MVDTTKCDGYNKKVFQSLKIFIGRNSVILLIVHYDSSWTINVNSLMSEMKTNLRLLQYCYQSMRHMYQTSDNFAVPDMV